MELKKWPLVLQRLSGMKPADLAKEMPKIYLRRDAKLMPSVEENVSLLSENWYGKCETECNRIVQAFVSMRYFPFLAEATAFIA